MGPRCLFAAASLACAGSFAHAQLFLDDFSTDTSADYTVVNDGAPDGTVTFNYDYSADSIPPAPNTGDASTTGLRITANDTLGATDAFTVFRNVGVTGNYTLRVDVYMFVAATSGSTEYCHIGVAGDGASFNQVFTPIAGSGAFMAMTGEGGSSGSDYRHFTAEITTVPSSDPSYLAGSGMNTAQLYQDIFPNSNGTPMNQWVEVEISVISGTQIIYSLNGTPIFDASTAVTDGQPSLGYADVFTSVANPFQSNFVVYDNFRVDLGSNPTGACCFNDSTCTDGTLVDCLNAGGTFQGDGTNCATTNCPFISAACCLVDGTCIDTTVDDCFAQNGLPDFEGTECATSPACPDLTPPNDLCVNAQLVSNLPAVVQGDNITSTPSADGACGTAADGAFGANYYEVIGTGNRMVISTCPTTATPGSANFDTQLRVFEGPCGSLVCVDGNDDADDTSNFVGCGTTSVVAWDSTQGVSYIIVVGGFGDGIGDYDLAVFDDVTGACCFPDATCQDILSSDCASQAGSFQGSSFMCANIQCPDLRPENDNCPTATVITAGSTSTISSEFAGADDGTSGCAPSNTDLWWSFTPSQSGPYTIDTIGSSYSDTVLDIFDGCGGARIFCDDDGAGVLFQSAMTIFLDSGTDYRIRVSEFGSAPAGPGDVTLNISDVPTIVGGCCVDAVCTVQTPADCATAGGDYLGDFSNCGESDLALADDGNTLVSLPFSFDYFGNTFNAVTVSANGYLTFGNDGSDFTNEPIGDNANPNNLIATYWADFDPTEGGTVNARATGSSLIVQWADVPQPGGTDLFNFEAVLNSDGTIEFRYQTIFFAAASVGLENEDASESVFVDASTLNDGDCVLFTPDGLGSYTTSACANAVEDITAPLDVCDTGCPCEYGGNPDLIDIADLLAFLALWFVADPGSDFNGDGDFVGAGGSGEITDLLAFLACYFTALDNAGACP